MDCTQISRVSGWQQLSSVSHVSQTPGSQTQITDYWLAFLEHSVRIHSLFSSVSSFLHKLHSLVSPKSHKMKKKKYKKNPKTLFYPKSFKLLFWNLRNKVSLGNH